MGGNKTGRKRLKSEKHKKWKKGQSSSSNPVIKKHREAAKTSFFTVNTGPSSLTVDALAKHDADTADPEVGVSFSEAGTESRSVSAHTFNTWATHWTDCTNASFSKVHRYWPSNSSMHKEILAILAAVTEVIKMKGGKETETEYFAALMTTLDAVESEESKAAVVYLLNLVIKRVPAAVVQSQMSQVSKTMLELMAEHVDTDTPALLRSALMCVAHVLRLQEQAVWENSSTLQVFNGLLAYVTHPKPKVRKAAQHAVVAVLKGSSFMSQADPPPHHPASSVTAKYCIQIIEESGGANERTAALHVLGLLKEVLAILPHHSLKSACEAILRLMTLSNPVVSSVCMQTLHGMFVLKPKSTSLPPDLNAQLIIALYDYQPGEMDAQPMSAWLTLMQAAHVNLSRQKSELCLSHLPRLFSSCMSCLQTGRQDVAQSAAKTITCLLTECVSPVITLLGEDWDSAPPTFTTPIHKLFTAMEGGLGYQYHASWGIVLQLLKLAFHVMGRPCHSIMRKCLASLAELRDSHQFPHKGALEAAVGEAVTKLGPGPVLNAIPLNINPDSGEDLDLERSWLLPVFRDNIQNTELAFFTTHFLPLAARLRTKSIEFASEDKVASSKTYDALQMQIWSLLPGFCTKPTDLKQSFKGIARILGSAIQDRDDLRMEVMASLRKLVLHSMNDDECRTEVSRYAKNYVPIFFNLYTSEPEKQRDPKRMAVLETTKCYMTISDNELIGSFFDKCYDKIAEKDISAFRRHALVDLTIAMVPYVDSSRLSKVLPVILKQLESSDRTVQKKSYRVLEEMCASESPECRAFIQENLSKLEHKLIKSLSKSSPSAKAPRLRCLIHIFKQLKKPHKEFMKAVVPEAVLCTKEVAEKARSAAYLLLVEMGNTLIRWQGEQHKNQSVQDYFVLVLSGLAGSPHIVSCTLLAVSRILFQFKDCTSNDLLNMLVDSICLLLTSKTREIVQASLGVLKVMLTIIPVTTMAQFLQKIVNSLVMMKEDNRHHFRFKSKEVFMKLIRKYGYDVISGMCPDSHSKMLVNIRKTQDRAKRKKQQDQEDVDEDEQDEEEMDTKDPENIDELLRDTDSELEEGEETQKKKKVTKKLVKTKKGAAWLKEAGEEEIVDFMDASVSKKVLATKPGKAETKPQSKNHGFKMASDGRFIIQEDEADDEAGKKGAEPLIDDLDELLDAMEHHSKSRKRKPTSSVDALQDEEDDKPTYKAGGSGIHRPLVKKQRSSQPGEEYRAKKAKGDIKKKGKPDPFAYIPLQFKNLNRRKGKKAAGQFSNLVKGARKGAQKGSQMKKHKKHKR